MENTYKELTVWITRNQPQFTREKYSIEDIMRLSIACGFDRSAVAQWVTRTRFTKAA